MGRFVEITDCDIDGCPECGSPVTGERDRLTGAASYRCTETADGPCGWAETEDGFDGDECQDGGRDAV